MFHIKRRCHSHPHLEHTVKEETRGMVCPPEYKTVPNIEHLSLFQHGNKRKDCCVYCQGLPAAVTYGCLEGFYERAGACLLQSPVWCGC